MDIFIRGNVVEFSTQFFDASNNPVVPDSVALTIVTAPQCSASQTIPLTMTNSGDTWTADWDTTGIPGGLIYWAIKATAPHAADEGSFALATNPANQ